MFSEADKEIEFVRGLVAQRFPVYETRVTPNAVQFLVRVDPGTMEGKFEDLRKELVPKNYIPFLAMEGGEHVVLIQRRTPQRFVTWHVNLALFVLTIGTTLLAGAANWAGYEDIDLLTPQAFLFGGLYFTLPLLLILGIHEMGHYVVAKRYQVHASLPFFLPAPFTFLGTFGAMISMRDPMPNRKALIDIGAAGPVLGLITAIPITALGMFLMAVSPHPIPVNTGGNFSIELPLLYQIIGAFIPLPSDALIHPTALAGWVGLFVTALNLLPAGQLDGGHIARAVLGDKGKYLSYAALVSMLVIGILPAPYGYPGWLIIAIFILVLGARHPPPLNDLTHLDTKRYGLAGAAALVLALSFVAVPLTPIEADVGVQFEAPAAPSVPVVALEANVTNQSTATYVFVVRNVGNVETNVSLTIDPGDLENVALNASFSDVQAGNRTGIPFTWNTTWFTLNSTEAANITISLDATGYGLATGLPWTFHVRATGTVEGLSPVGGDLALTLRVVP